MSNRVPSRSVRRRRRTPWGRILAVIMAAATAVNLAQFRQIESETRHNYRALYPYETSDLFEIAISRDDSSRRWVAPFFYLGVLLPDSVVFIPTEGISSWFPFEESVISFGRAAQIARVDYDPVTFVDLSSLDKYRIETSAFAPDAGRAVRIVEERVSYFVGEVPSGRVLVITPEGPPGRTNPIAFVDMGLLENEDLRRLGVP